MSRLTKFILVRYIISGGASAATNLFILSLLYYVFGVYYILSSVIAFIFAFFVSLTMHKFWTFKDHSMNDVHIQAGKYLLSALFGLLINTSLLYMFVDYFHVYVFFGQVFSSLITACVTFFISRDLIFNRGYSIQKNNL